MIMHKRILVLMALGLPLTAFAAVPVVDGSAAGSGGYTTAGYGAAASYAEAGAAAPVSAQGQVFMQLQQLQQEVQQLRGLIEEQQNEILLELDEEDAITVDWASEAFSLFTSVF